MWVQWQKDANWIRIKTQGVCQCLWRLFVFCSGKRYHHCTVLVVYFVIPEISHSYVTSWSDFHRKQTTHCVVTFLAIQIPTVGILISKTTTQSPTHRYYQQPNEWSHHIRWFLFPGLYVLLASLPPAAIPTSVRIYWSFSTMGNQLVSSVKTVIKPIDYYLTEFPEIKLKQSLGQTQFLKVALCLRTDHRGLEGDVVVKVLSHEDPSLLLEPYQYEIRAFDKYTANHASIATFRIVEIRPHFAFMIRQYVRYSLYDRLSTRPFLTDIEKCWIVYQVLRCMDWCHKRHLHHGDIKLENIMVTSNLWVIMADFATYKPTLLPEVCRVLHFYHDHQD